MLVESVNARDPELIGQVDLPDVSGLEATIQTVNERWPRMMMTHGDIGDSPVAVVWMPDKNER